MDKLFALALSDPDACAAASPNCHRMRILHRQGTTVSPENSVDVGLE